jgi:hypothetical protein
MAYPRPVLSLNVEEFAAFRERVDEFEPPEKMEDEIAQHREAIGRNS